MNEGHPVKQGTRGRLWFWWVFLFVAVSHYIFEQYIAAPRQTVDFLQPVISADFRFKKVNISRSTIGAVLVSGDVQSIRDLNALTDLIRGNTTPLRPIISVKVSSNSE
jgi:hypothetical protein